MRKVRVVAAVIRRGGAILITRRHDQAERGGQWEFPGGKVEEGESEAEALRRELREELGCEIEIGRLLARHFHRYPDLEVDLAFYACALPEDAAPRALGVGAIEWAKPEALESYDFCDADRPVLGAIERG